MVFVSLYESLQRGELIMVDGGMCQYRLRKDGQITMHVILSNKPGAGKQMLQQLKQRKTDGATHILARCPITYESNTWYDHNGFILDRVEGKNNVWILVL